MRTATRLRVFFGSLSALGGLAFALLWLHGVPALGVEGIMSAEQRRSELAVDALADKERDNFEHWFAVQRRMLRLFANSDALVHPWGASTEAEKQSLSRQLLALKDAEPGAYAWLYLASSADQSLLLGTEGHWVGVPANERAVLEEAALPGMLESVSLSSSTRGASLLIVNQVPDLDVEGLPKGLPKNLLVANLALLGPLQTDESSIRQSLGEDGAVLLLDRVGRVLAVRSANEERDFSHVSAAQVSGAEGLKLLHDERGAEQIAVFRHLHVGAAEGLSLVILCSTKEALSASHAAFLRVSLLGGVFFVLAMALVIFAARRIDRSEAEVLNLNTSLEARVQARTQELATSNAQLSEALQHLEETRDDLFRSEKLAALGALVAGVAHELNTPIGNALLAGSTLQSSAESFRQVAETGMRRSELFAHLDENVSGTRMLVTNLQRAAALVGGFKQLTADQTSDQRREFVLLQVLDEVVVAMGPSLRRAQHPLTVDVPADLRLDSYPGPMGRIIVNFINNALLHAFVGDAKGEMQLSARVLDEQQFELRFSDNGVGMGADVARRVFDPYFTTKLGQGGSGLGMHIAYNLVSNLLGGRIDIVTAPGEGTCFVLRLPFIAPPHPQPNAAEPGLGSS